MWGTRKRSYLDWAAASPVSPEAERVFRAALPYSGNPNALHGEARAARALLEEARTNIARLAEMKPEGVVFTSGATEANALAILGAVRARGVSGAHVLYHPAQHASVIGAVEMLKEEGVSVEEIDIAKLASQIRPDTVLVTMDLVCGETGTRHDTLAVRRTLDAFRAGILLHVDASQAPFAESFMLSHVGADMLSLDAQKVGGIRGIGALLLRRGITLAPLMRGGGQERGRRPGTESPALALAFSVALREAAEGRQKFVERATSMRNNLLMRMRELPNIEVNEGAEKVPHILNVSCIGRDTDYLVMLLDKAGFAVSTKSACETDATGSRAVLAYTGDATRAEATLRISWGPVTKERELIRFADAFAEAIRFLDEKTI
ncbi:MAG: cysteine desulfurase family protein [Bacillota bacterium]